MTINTDDQAIVDELTSLASTLPAKLAAANQAAIDAAVAAAVAPLQAELTQAQQDHTDGTTAIKTAADQVVSAAS